MGLGLYDNIDMFVTKMWCWVMSSFYCKRYFYVFFFFLVETWSIVYKVLVYLMVGTQFCGNRVLANLWIWVFYSQDVALESHFLCHKIYSFVNRMNPSSKHKQDSCACFFMCDLVSFDNAQWPKWAHKTQTWR
jgi:hypothetical protein